MTALVTQSADVDKELLLWSVRVPPVDRVVDTTRVVRQRTVFSREHSKRQLNDVNEAWRTASWSNIELRASISEAL